jgi:hypothetical protein
MMPNIGISELSVKTQGLPVSEKIISPHQNSDFAFG